MKLSYVGVDLAKNVFQVHGVNRVAGPNNNQQRDNTTMKPRSPIVSVFLLLSILSFSLMAGDSEPRIASVTPICAGVGELVSIRGRGFGAQNLSIEVGGIAIKPSKANGHTAEFHVPENVPTGFTTIVSRNPGGQLGSIGFQVRTVEVCGNGLDDDCDNVIDEIDECPLATISSETSPFELSIRVGEKRNISTIVAVDAPASAEFHIVTSQSVAPIGNSSGDGVTVSPSAEREFAAYGNSSSVVNQEVSANTVGEYTITTSATVLETGATTSSVARISVTESAGALHLMAPGSLPYALAEDSATETLFTVLAVGDATNSAQTIRLREETGTGIVVVLNDSGVDGDKVARRSGLLRSHYN